MANYKIKELHDALDRLEAGKPSIYSIEWCTNRIDWLWRFRHISEEEKDELCEQAIRILERRD